VFVVSGEWEMATTVLGDDSVPKTKFQALAGELRLLKSGMADMQGRLDALLIEIGTELGQVCKTGEPTGEVLPDGQEVEVAPAVAESLPEGADAEAAIVAEAELPAPASDETASSDIDSQEAIVATTEATVVETTSPVMQIETVEAVGIADTSVATEVAAVEPVAAGAEIADIAVPAEVPAIEMTATPATSADPVAQPIAVEAQTADTPVAATPADNVVVLAERRAAPRKGRSVIAQTARWAAVIALIVMAAAITATGRGFAGNGELLTLNDLCAIASDVCAIVSGIP
jgi:hypothetical protein